MVLGICGCAGEDLIDPEKEEVCLDKKFQESFTMEPGQCVTLQEFPTKTFTFLKLSSSEKRELWVPSATIAYSIQEVDSYQEVFDVMISEDYQEEGTSFSGRFHIILDGNVPYTIFVDKIDFTETETEYIFKKVTLRFSEYDPEY